jgi:DnaJ-domain-containing protein 1
MLAERGAHLRLCLAARWEISPVRAEWWRAVTSNHYDSLGVSPWAEDAVIRAAYRALMRLYHPDTNQDPQAQSRVREINSAFAVLGNPEKRAAYDALQTNDDDDEAGEGPWFAGHHRSRPPMRNLGLASVGVALTLGLAVAVWPVSEPQQEPRRAAGNTKTSDVAAGLELLTAPKWIAPHVDAKIATRAPPPPAAPALEAKPEESRGEASLPGRQLAHSIVVPAAKSTPMPTLQARTSKPPASVATPRSQIAQVVPPRAAVPSRMAARREPAGASMAQRQAQVARIATGFLQQSLEHADWHKQQLLLSARNRAATSRNLCRSDECVTGAYLRQIREITAIMDGRTPTQ